MTGAGRARRDLGAPRGDPSRELHSTRCAGKAGRRHATMPRHRRRLAASAALFVLVGAAYLWLPWPSDLVVTAILLLVVAVLVAIDALIG